MLAAIELSWVATAQAQLGPGGLLNGITTVIDTPPETGLQDAQFPVLELCLNRFSFSVFRAGINFSATPFVVLTTLDFADTLQVSKRNIQRLLWSDDAATGLIPFMYAYNGINIGPPTNQRFVIQPGDFSLKFLGRNPSGQGTWEAAAPITIKTMR